jgi:hypothetical protein
MYYFGMRHAQRVHSPDAPNAPAPGSPPVPPTPPAAPGGTGAPGVPGPAGHLDLGARVSALEGQISAATSEILNLKGERTKGPLGAPRRGFILLPWEWFE